MTYKKTPLSLWISGFILTILLVGSILLLGVCKSVQKDQSEKETSQEPKKQQPPYQETTDKDSTISWNVLFKPGTSQAAKDKFFNAVCSKVNEYYGPWNRDPTHTKKLSPICRKYFCPCDPTLMNIDIVIYGTGESATTPTQPNKPGGGGDVAVVSVNRDVIMSEASDTGEVYLTTPFDIKVANRNDNLVLGVIDTGLDPMYFTSNTQKLIWKDRNQATLFNTLPFQDPRNGFDDHKQKHGSAVTALALEAMKNTVAYPRIMVLKALNKDKMGSIFSVSCALSYAAQNNVTMVNASLGYYSNEQVDPVLKKYVDNCINHTPEPIILMAAAGNMDAPHNMPLCNKPGTANELGHPKVFYPACMTPLQKNLISVTGLRDEHNACFYQRYSNQYVSLGVRNTNEQCCYFWISTLRKAYEGTSFATPAASGTFMQCFLKNNGNRLNAWADWNNLVHAAPTNGPAKKYINYP